MGRIVGIDLGTTNSLVATMSGDRPEIISNRLGKRLTPSAVGLDLHDRLIVGEPARNQLVVAPDRTAIEVKRYMGSDRRVRLGNRTYSPQEISALVLKSLKEDAEQYFNAEVNEAVVTVPAYFTDAQRQATKDAGELAGLRVERILNEPTAAALAYGLDHLDSEQFVVVYDLGGGTLDVSVLEMFQGVLDVKASAGNNRLGGSDFDAAIIEWLCSEFTKRHGVDLHGDPGAMVRLKAAAEQAKVELSSLDSTLVVLPHLAGKAGASLSLEIELSRMKLDALIGDLVRSTLEPIEAALRDAKVDRKNVSDIVVVGGSSRVPLVQQVISEFFGKAPRTGVHPDEAIALGAAVQAGLKSGSISSANGIMITDVAPFTLGVAVAGGSHLAGIFSPIIPRNSTIPVSRTEVYSTSHDQQTKVDIEVYQGESRLVRNNTFLGSYTVEGVPPGRAGQERVAITFAYDINGLLNVTTKIVSTGKEATLVIDKSNARMSEAERAQATTRLQQEWKEGAASASEPALAAHPSAELLATARARLSLVTPEQHARLAVLVDKLEAALRLGDAEIIARADTELTNFLFDLD